MDENYCVINKVVFIYIIIEVVIFVFFIFIIVICKKVN